MVDLRCGQYGAGDVTIVSICFLLVQIAVSAVMDFVMVNLVICNGGLNAYF